MKNARHYRKSDKNQKMLTSVAVTAALALSAGLPAMAAEAENTGELPADETTLTEVEGQTTDESAENETSETKEAENTETEEDTRTDEEKHQDNQTIVEETNPEKIDDNQEEIEKLPELDTGEDESGDAGETGGSSEQEELESTLEQKGDEIKDFELSDMPQAPEVDGLTQTEAEELKSAYESAVEEYNRLIEGEGGYNANVDAYNEALNHLKDLIDKNNQNTAENVNDAAKGNGDKTEENDQTIEDNKDIVTDNEKTMEDNETENQLNHEIEDVKNTGSDLVGSEVLDKLNAAKADLERIEITIAGLDTSSMSEEKAAEANQLLADYENAVKAYEAAVVSYNADVEEYRTAVEKYNQALEQYIKDYNEEVIKNNNTSITENHGTGDTSASGTINDNADTVEKNQTAVSGGKGEEVEAGTAGSITIDENGVVTITENGKQYTLTLESKVSEGDVAEALKNLQQVTEPTEKNFEGKSPEEIKEIVETYNTAVTAYNKALASYNENVSEYNAAIEKYEEALGAYNRVINANNGTIENANGSIVQQNNTRIDDNKADTDKLTENSNTITGNQSIHNSDTSYAEINEDGKTVTIRNGSETYVLETNSDGTITITTPDGKQVTSSTAANIAKGVPFNSNATTIQEYNNNLTAYIAAIEKYNTDVAAYNEFIRSYGLAMEAYTAVVNMANTSIKGDNTEALTDNTLETILNFNDKSTAIANGTGKEYTVKSANGEETSRQIKNAEAEYNSLKEEVETAQAALLKNAEFDLTKPDEINKYNELIARYNLAAENYNNFVKVCNGATADSSIPEVTPVEIENLPLFVTTSIKDSQFFIVKDSTVPEETGDTEYSASGYTPHDVLMGSVLVGTMDVNNLIFGGGNGRVEVVNMYTPVSDAELPEGFDTNRTYLKDKDGNYYTLNGGHYLCPVIENEMKGPIELGPYNLYRYKYENGKLYVVSTGGGRETYATGVKNGYINAYTPNSQNIIVKTEFNTSKFNFDSEEALADYFRNVGILVEGGSTPNDAQMKDVIKENFDEEIYEAYKNGKVGIQWYVVKDNQTGSKDPHVHVDGALYWKNTLEVVDHSKMNTLDTLTPVKNVPASAGEATELTKTLDTKKQSLTVRLDPLNELAPLTGGGDAKHEDSWKEARSYQTLTPADFIVSPWDKLEIPTGSFVATEVLDELDPLTPIEGDEIIIRPTDPIVIIPIITPGDGELIQEIVKEITPQLPVLLEQGEAEAEPAEVVTAQTPQEKLPQTGQNWSLASLLSALGTLLVAAGIVSRKGKHEA